jgi:excisionase family DNA binding protein
MVIILDDIKLYDLKEVAKILNLNRRTIYRYLKDKKFKARRVGYIWYVEEKDLKEFLNIRPR